MSSWPDKGTCLEIHVDNVYQATCNGAVSMRGIDKQIYYSSALVSIDHWHILKLYSPKIKDSARDVRTQIEVIPLHRFGTH